jgi:hypothetical protein
MTCLARGAAAWTFAAAAAGEAERWSSGSGRGRHNIYLNAIAGCR